MEYLEETRMLDYKNKYIETLIMKRNWSHMSDKDKILHAYNYVRDEIEFGYNIDDEIPASQVLLDGYGQCNTKGTLFMALLRALNIPCRMHGFMISKKMQKGAMKGFYYRIAPNDIVHSWVEVYYNNKWLNLEGFILDITYLNKLQQKFSNYNDSFCGYGVAIHDFQNPPINWIENDTYIQKDGITEDLGIFQNPDEFFKQYKQRLSIFKKFIYQKFIRHLMNRNIRKIRHA